VVGAMENGKKTDSDSLAPAYFSFDQCVLDYPDVTGRVRITIGSIDDINRVTYNTVYRLAAIKHEKTGGQYFNALILDIDAKDLIFIYLFIKDNLYILSPPWERDIYIVKSEEIWDTVNSRAEFASGKGSDRTLYSLSRQPDLP
jgi:hypothetical protein